MKTTSVRLARAAAAVSIATGLALAPVLGAGVADAHVVARTSGIGEHGFGVVTFMVPNESDTAATTELKVAFPGIKHLLPEAKPGWTAHVAKNDQGAVTEIRWAAVPGTPGIPIGQFAEFNVSGGPFTGELTLPATQIYADGETVAWDQATGPGGEEPEKPAPTINAASEASSSSSSDGLARWLGGAGLLAGVAGVGAAIAAMRARRNDAAGTASAKADSDG
ncbi:hypothetical protein GOARA_056_00660 [Gordonia araii NBRC 100433]|uniref:YncI copper-binding domain-containing protein n=1 Tax=Gordonia araii NBRC 100433 TaxID=1073574 RepID=G7H394_9ACTN|nr:YcnI family protein [Gordonia araii]NNG96437.1 YcnI family protein [Gordonia araii NBRC 100433]GAB10319.1 hypothetical protein GOARA_056_00660 [Gordonia araii NBRC 100433]